MTQDSSPPASGRRRVPPLIWVLLAGLVSWFVIALVQRDHDNVTPGGDDVPAAAQGPSVMPAAPAQGAAPATPANVADGAQPSR